MNRAWIPAGALASVSVAGLIALGPLTDSLHTAGVVPVRRDGFRADAAEERCRSAYSPPAESVGNIEHAALTASAGRASAEQSGDIGQVARRRSRSQPRSAVARDGAAAAAAPADAGEEEDHQARRRRSAAAAGRTVTRASRRRHPQRSRRVAASSRARPAATPPETAGRPGRVGKIRALGAIAQLGERLDRTQEVSGSSPLSSIAALQLTHLASAAPIAGPRAAPSRGAIGNS